MTDFEEIRQAALKAALSNNDIAAMEKAASVNKLFAESQKLEVEAQNVRRVAQAEGRRYWASIVVPFLSVVIVALSLGFQVLQFKETNQAQRNATEDTQWRQAVTAATAEKVGITSMTGGTLLKGFLDSPRYQQQSRELCILLLAQTVNLDAFENIFREIAHKTSWSNVEDVIRLNRILKRHYTELSSEEQEFKAAEEAQQKQALSQQQRAGQPAPPTSILQRRLSSRDPGIGKTIVDQELQIVGVSLADLLRTSRQPDFKLDLSDTALWDFDMSKANLSGAIMKNVMLYNLSLRGAVITEAVLVNVNFALVDLSDIEEFKGSKWESTAWWMATKIGPKLLAYLEESFPFSDGKSYANPETDATKERYKERVADLQKLAIAK